MVRVAYALVNVLVAIGACTWPLGCAGPTSTASEPDAGGPDAAMGDSALGMTDVSTAADCCLDGLNPNDSMSVAQDVVSASDGGESCIGGCMRGTVTCGASDPPVGWRCDGPGIDASDLFLEAGCTSVPINSIAWCCPSAFLSQCICTPGRDWTCNDDPTISSIHGTCQPDGTCTCSIGSGLNPATGKCR